MGYKVWIIFVTIGTIIYYLIMSKPGELVKRDTKKFSILYVASLLPVLIYFIIPNSVDPYAKNQLVLLSVILVFIGMVVYNFKRN